MRTTVAGTFTWIRQRRWHVERMVRETGTIRFDVVADGERRTFLWPFDRPRQVAAVSRPVRVRPAGGRARMAGLLAGTFGVRSIRSAADANIDLYPHQLEPVLAFIDGWRRLLVADEVGLGKTIQAGLALAELNRRCPNLRALVVAPAGLCDQWRQELAARFRIRCRPAEAVAETAEEWTFRGDDPWLHPGVWIGSIDYLKQDYVRAAIPSVPWDLVVVDEAHTAAGRSDRHAAVHALCRGARRVMLLTATPHSGNTADFGRLVSIGHLGTLDPAIDGLLVFRRTRATVGLHIQRRVRWHRVPLRPVAAQMFDKLVRFERAVRASSASTADESTAALLCSVLLRRACSTLTSLDRTLARRLEWLRSRKTGVEAADWLQPRLPLNEDEDDDEVPDDERRALTATTWLPAGREIQALEGIRALLVNSEGADAKLSRLIRLLGRANEPAVVFTEFRDSLQAVVSAVGVRHTVAELHGGMSQSERRRELDRFLGGQAAVLVATDVAGQGLNLQPRARWVINLDIPWNPVRLEQRIGRVDRIGQRKHVHVTVLELTHGADARLRLSLSERVGVAQDAFNDVVYRLWSSGPGDRAPEQRRPTGDRPARGFEAATRWRLGAQATVVLVERTRRFARCWRAAAATSGRVFYWRRKLPSMTGRPIGSLLAFEVDFDSASGDTLERRVIVVAVPVAIDPRRPPAGLIAHAAMVVRAAVAARLQRVRRIVAERERRDRIASAAVVSALAAVRDAHAPQPTLFGPRRRVPASDELTLTQTPRPAERPGEPTDEPTDEQRAVAKDPVLRWIWTD
jgi:superfamily II DNA or RNA helicase